MSGESRELKKHVREIQYLKKFHPIRSNNARNVKALSRRFEGHHSDTLACESHEILLCQRNIT